MTEPAAAKLKLNYPQQLVEYPTYEEAQATVDFLADKEFPVENLLIVGTNLKLMERVTGRRTWTTVLTEGVLSGISTGLLVGLMLFFFSGTANLNMIWIGLLMGIVFGVIARGLVYSMSGGKRDFNSARLTVATSYEILVEHKVAQQARELINQRPGARAAMFE